MPDLEAEDFIAVQRSRISRAEKKREEERKTWKKIEAAIDGALRPSPAIWPEQALWIGNPKTHSSIRAMVPSLLYSNAKFSVTPKRAKMAQASNGVVGDVSWEYARIKQMALNHVWSESAGNKHARVGITASFIAFGTMKAGYCVDFEDDETRGVFATDETTGDLIIGADGLPELERGDYMRDDDGNIVVESDGMPQLNPGKLRRQTFFVDYTHYDSMLFDPDGGNVFESTHQWVAEEILRPVEDVRNDPNYDKKAREGVSATHAAGDRPGQDENANFELTATNSEDAAAVERDSARVKLYDIYDFRNRRIYTIPGNAPSQRNRDSKGRFERGSTSNDVILRDVELPAYMEHGPFRFLRMNERPGNWYPIPDGRAMVELELACNLVDSQQAEHRRNALPRWLEKVGSGFAEEEGGDIEKRKFLMGGPYTITQVHSTEGIISAPVPQLDSTHFSAKQILDRDFREAAGSPGEMSGVASADTATQASILAGSADVRNNDRRDNLVQAWLAETGRLLLQTMQANLQGSIFVKVAGEDAKALGLAENSFFEIDRTKLEGEFEVEVAIGSTQPKNSANRLRMMIDIGTMISQNPAIGFMPTYLDRLFEAADIYDPQLKAEALQMAQAATGVAPTANNPEQTQQLAPTVANGAANGQSRSTGAAIN
jgi:hypothetical protein